MQLLIVQGVVYHVRQNCCCILNFITFTVVPVGYHAILNATQYEFDINVYSPVGTTVFKALVIEESPGDIFAVDSAGLPTQFNKITSNTTIIITLNTPLNPSDEAVVYRFMLTAIVVSRSQGVLDQTVDVILYESGKSL